MRTCAALAFSRKWVEAGLDPNADADADLSLLTHENELRFLRKALELSEVIELVVNTSEPHHLRFMRMS